MNHTLIRVVAPPQGIRHIIIGGNPLEGYRARGDDRHGHTQKTDRGRAKTPEAALAAFLGEHAGWDSAPAYLVETKPTLPMPRDGFGFDL